MNAGREITIGLLGHTTTSSNLGIGALTIADMRIIKEAASALGHSVHFEIAAWREPNDPYITGDNVTYHQLSRKFLTSPGGMWAMARRCSLMVDICGGDSFTDLYGTKRFLYQIAAQRITLAAGTPLGFAPQTIGPFQRTWVQKAAVGVMRKSAFVFARDQLSTAYAAEISGKNLNLKEATDVAFLLPYDQPTPIKDGKVHVGINVSGLLFSGGYTGKNEFGLKLDYAALIRDLVSYFNGLDECTVHLISHVIRPDNSMAKEDDHAAALQLAREFEGVIAEPPAHDPGMAKSQIAAMDFFFGARMHACIAAFSSGVPVIPMAYSRKFIGLFGTLGYYHVADCRQMDAMQAHKMIVDGYHNRATLKQAVGIALKDVDQRLETYRDCLTTALRNPR
ncbi:polysaccharide pyruvyl transferase family protein [uncultured Tateyamaria sp.]|uniref:polysaccharide pyruvyl transferase family protein n=1 Tax=uncultured Tateyamaria sp. TaxID=455651 RepID=UPI0026154D81|nr:polysaccharide pyruvyl transferase family protein [uncultured Tateyamaria sp.]